MGFQIDAHTLFIIIERYERSAKPHLGGTTLLVCRSVSSLRIPRCIGFFACPYFPPIFCTLRLRQTHGQASRLDAIAAMVLGAIERFVCCSQQTVHVDVR